MAINASVYTVPSFVTGASQTSGMPMPGAWLYMFLQVPTMSAGYSAASTPIYIKGSADGVTYYRYTNLDNTVNTLVVGTSDFIVASSVSQRLIPLNSFALPYIQIEISGTCTTPASAAPFKVICVSNQ